jgi:hypothetical protein
MLVEVMDVRGNRYWINPIYVKAIKRNRRGHGILYGSLVGNMTGTIKTREPAETLADRVSAAMPEGAAWQAIGPIEADEEARRQAAAAAVAAAG